MSERDSLAALRTENTRLIALLELHEIDWRLPSALPSIIASSEPSRLKMKRWPSSAGCFKAEPTHIRFAGRAKPQGSWVTHRPVPTSGLQVALLLSSWMILIPKLPP